MKETTPVAAKRAPGHRAVLLEEPPRLDAHEITGRGSINQRAVLEKRVSIVEALYCEMPPPSVLRTES